MKPVSGALAALLVPSNAAQKFIHADLYTWTLVTGEVDRYTSADRDLTIGGHTWIASNALFRRGKTSSYLGLQVPTLEVTVMPRSSDTIGGLPWIQAARAGNLDGATVLVERFISDSWANTAVGTVYQFFGSVSQLKPIDRSKFTVKLSAPTQSLNQPVPRNVHQATCVHTLYDAGCALLKASFTVSGLVGTGSTANAIKTNLTQADAYFNLGVIKFTSGANAGIQRTIDSYAHTNGLVVLPYLLPQVPGNGDSFTIYPGCNKVYTGDCLGKFNNQANFKGTPFVPVAETAY